MEACVQNEVKFFQIIRGDRSISKGHRTLGSTVAVKMAVVIWHWQHFLAFDRSYGFPKHFHDPYVLPKRKQARRVLEALNYARRTFLMVIPLATWTSTAPLPPSWHVQVDSKRVIASEDLIHIKDNEWLLPPSSENQKSRLHSFWKSILVERINFICETSGYLERHTVLSMAMTLWDEILNTDSEDNIL